MVPFDKSKNGRKTKHRHSLVCQTHERYLPNCTTQWTMSNMVSMIKRNAAVNADGFGVGWYNLEVDPEPCIFTSIAPAEHNVNLARLSKKIQSHLIFGHVRAASPGSPVNDTNCHPFQFGRYLWMHNGCIAHWSAVKRPVTALLSSCAFAYISGTTDSEVAGALFVDQLPGHDPHREHSPQDIIDAMKRTIQIITQSVRTARIPTSCEADYSSLNFAVSDGKTVVATRFRDSPTDEPPSLYYCLVTNMEMVGNEMEILHDATKKPKGVVIASEPLTYQSENWTLIPKNHMLVVTNGTEIQLLPIIDTAEPVSTRWISEIESHQHAPLNLSPADLNKFFGTRCCCCTASSEPLVPPASASEIGRNSGKVNVSAPASPTLGSNVYHHSSNGHRQGHYSSQQPTTPSKSAMILESPIMTGALRALLASATPSQLREILESNLLPCRSATSSAPPIDHPRSRRSHDSARDEDFEPQFDYATVSSVLSPSSSTASLPMYYPEMTSPTRSTEIPMTVHADRHYFSSPRGSIDDEPRPTM